MASHSLRAVTYLRKSTDKQEASIPDQREAVEKLARQKGYVIIHEYKDEGISGDDTERRAGFLQMLEDAKRLGDFDCVLCWDQDRFGRFDPLEAGFWIKPLRDAGIFLETVAQGRIDWEDFAGRIVYAVQQEGKHAFLQDMSRNVTRGMLAKAKRGEWLGGRPPYGYRLNEYKRLVSHAGEAEIVRWLFAEYLARDIGCALLAEELNGRGVPGPGGKKWSGMTVYKVITHPTYLGHYVWNRRHIGRYHCVRNGEIARSDKPKQKTAANNAEAEWVVFEDTHEALVDRAAFDRVRQKLIARRDSSTPLRGGGDFLFTGLLRCGRCGWPMHGCRLHYSHNGRRHSYRRYICGNYNLHRRSGCVCNTVLERDLLGVVVRILRREFLNPENLAALKAEIRRQEEAERQGRERPAADLNRRIADLDRKIKTGTQRWLTAPASLTGVLGETLEEWRKEREELLARRREVEKPARTEADLDRAVEEIAAGLEALDRSAAEAPAAQVREVLKQIIDHIDLHFRHIPFGAGRQKSVLEGGEIHLRDDLILCRPVPLARPLTTVHPARTSPAAKDSVIRRP
jgi:DNA invertase Pin-like site-specific DNA recombinase